MAKHGGIKHLKRIAAPHAIAITNKKEYTWISKAAPGPHDGQHAVPLGVLIRGQLSLCNTNREGKKVLTREYCLLMEELEQMNDSQLGLWM